MINKNVVIGIILAAGKSTRMKKHKILLPWGPRSVLGQVIFTIQQAGINHIRVVTGFAADAVKAEAQRFGAGTAHNADFENQEMLSSIQAGLGSISQEFLWSLIALGDNPQIEFSVIQSILDACDSSPDIAKIILPSFKMRRGHPWLIRRDYWGEILSMDTSQSMRNFFKNHEREITYVNVSTDSILKDLDTQDDYQRDLPA